MFTKAQYEIFVTYNSATVSVVSSNFCVYTIVCIQINKIRLLYILLCNVINK